MIEEKAAMRRQGHCRHAFTLLPPQQVTFIAAAACFVVLCLRFLRMHVHTSPLGVSMPGPRRASQHFISIVSLFSAQPPSCAMPGPSLLLPYVHASPLTAAHASVRMVASLLPPRMRACCASASGAARSVCASTFHGDGGLCFCRHGGPSFRAQDAAQKVGRPNGILIGYRPIYNS